MDPLLLRLSCQKIGRSIRLPSGSLNKLSFIINEKDLQALLEKKGTSTYTKYHKKMSRKKFDDSAKEGVFTSGVIPCPGSGTSLSAALSSEQLSYWQRL
jgi:hypothetical protein